MRSLQAITPEPTTASAPFSSAIGTPKLEIRARAAASTIVRGNRAGGGKTRTPRVGHMVAKGHKRTNHHGRKSTVVHCCPKADIGREFMKPRPRAWLHKHSAKCRRGCSDACPLTVLSSIFPKRFGNYPCLQYIFRINKVKRQSNKQHITTRNACC